jgi:hypothetical protein
MSLLVKLALSCTLFGVVESGVSELVRKTSSSLLNASGEDGVKNTATLAGGYGALSVKAPPLAAAALKDDVRWMPLVDLAERHLATLVVCFDALDDLLHHGLLPLPPGVSSAGGCCPTAGSWVESCPEFKREEGSGPTLIRGVLLSRNKTILLSKRDEVQGQRHRLSTARSTSDSVLR